MGSFTAKQRAFIDAYVQHFNASQAALDAGYSERSAYSIGWENLRKPEIREEINRLLSTRIMTRDEALSRMSEQARADLGPYINELGVIDFDAMKRDGKTHLIKELRISRSAGKGIKYDVKLHDSQAALAKLLSEFSQKPDGSGDRPFNVKIEYVNDWRRADG